jgi:hypothetical protein
VLQIKRMEISAFLSIAAKQLAQWAMGISQQFSNTLSTLLKTFGPFSAAFLYPFSSAQWLFNSIYGAFPGGHWQNQGFMSIIIEETYFLFLIIKTEGAKKKFKNPQQLLIYHRSI